MALPYTTEQNVIKIVNEKLKDQPIDKDAIVSVVNEAIESGEIEAGGDVEANPSDEATETLSKLKVEDITYTVENPYFAVSSDATGHSVVTENKTSVLTIASDPTKNINASNNTIIGVKSYISGRDGAAWGNVLVGDSTYAKDMASVVILFI